jgi:hypothetical protein
MNKTSFLEIMRALNKEELKRFEAFLNSPYFNTRNNVIKLFGLIKNHSPEFENKMLDKEELWKKLFPGKEYNYGIIKNIIYDITKLAERFLETEGLNTDETQRMKYLLEKLGEKRLESIFFSKYNAYEKNNFQSSKYYYSYYEDYLKLKELRFTAEAYNPKLHSKLFSHETAELLIFEFMSKFSNNYNSVYIEETEYNEKPDNEFIKFFSKTVFADSGLEKYIETLSEKHGRKYKPALIFFRLMKCYQNPHSFEIYFEFKKTLFDNDRYIAESALRGLYASLGSALDNCQDVAGINKNRELFDIISHLVEKKIFTSEDGKVVPTLYLLAVKTSGYLKEPAFIESLMKDFLPATEPELKSNFGIFSQAYLNYAKGEYEQALDYSNKISIETFQMKYYLRNLQIIISYEKDDFEMFKYMCDSYKHFLSKNKSVSHSYRESNMKFLNYTNTLFKLREALRVTKDKSEIGFTVNELRKEVVVNKYWLIEKLNELSNPKMN